MAQQGWPLSLLKLVNGFLTGRKVHVRLENCTTKVFDIDCGTPQDSLLSPVLYILYLTELLPQNTDLRLRYTDNMALYKATHSLDNNIILLKKDLRNIHQ